MSRKVTKQGEEVQQWLVQWKGQTVEEATWEDVVTIKSQFPTFHLEDKVEVSEGSIDRNHVTEDETNEVMIYHQPNGPKVWRVYSRRGKKGKDQ